MSGLPNRERSAHDARGDAVGGQRLHAVHVRAALGRRCRGRPVRSPPRVRDRRTGVRFGIVCLRSLAQRHGAHRGARAAGRRAALLVPCSLALIGPAYDEKERGAATGVWWGASAIAAGVAPIVGGTLVDHWSWRAIFLINPLLAVPTIWIALARVPESRDPQAGTGLDWHGALLVFVGLSALVYG